MYAQIINVNHRRDAMISAGAADCRQSVPNQLNITLDELKLPSHRLRSRATLGTST